jgi:CubicO group peptidase (beta-lactamase class C family)
MDRDRDYADSAFLSDRRPAGATNPDWCYLRSMSRPLLALGLALLAFPYAVQAQDAPAGCPAPARLDDGWTIATPNDAGFDPDKLCPLDRFIGQRADADIHGVVVVRHGKLVMERYYKGTPPPESGRTGVIEFGPTVEHGVFSISKSVTSLLIGIARGEGRFPDLDAPAIDHLPATYADVAAPDNARITLRDLLTMSSGRDWNERRPYSDPMNAAIQMIRAPDPYRFVLQQPVTFKPGEMFNYSSGDTELLGLVLAHSVGRSIDDYARDKLLAPLGITDFEWWKMPNSGQPFAAAGLRLRPRDLAKLGQLLLTDGQWNGRQVIPKGWVAESTTPRIKAYQLSYGYQWWLGHTLLKDRDLHWTAGFGYGGQRLFVQPDLDLVVAVTAGEYADPQQRGAIPFAIFGQHVLPAITGD